MATVLLTDKIDTELIQLLVTKYLVIVENEDNKIKLTIENKEL